MPQTVKKRIGDLFPTYINGYSFKSDDFSNVCEEGMLPVLKIANVGTSEKTDFRNCHYHSADGFDRFVAHEGDLAFSLTGSLGYVSVVTEDCLVNQRVFVIRRKPEYAQLLDLAQPIIKSLEFTKYCYSKATSEANKNISGAVINDYEITVYLDDDGSVNIGLQKALALKYQDVEEKKKILLSKINALQDCKIIFGDDQSVTYALISLNDMVTHKNGKATYTKEYCQQHTGKIPVYSANNSGPIAYMNTSDYDGTYLTYSKNGCAGYITILDGEFSINGDRCVMKLNPGYEEIDLGYLKYFLQPIFRANIKGRIGVNGKNEYTKLNSTMIKQLDIKVPIPIKSDGTFDLAKQRELANKQAKGESIKKDLCKDIYKLIDVLVIN